MKPRERPLHDPTGIDPAPLPWGVRRRAHPRSIPCSAKLIAVRLGVVGPIGVESIGAASRGVFGLSSESAGSRPPVVSVVRRPRRCQLKVVASGMPRHRRSHGAGLGFERSGRVRPVFFAPAQRTDELSTGRARPVDSAPVPFNSASRSLVQGSPPDTGPVPARSRPPVPGTAATAQLRRQVFPANAGLENEQDADQRLTIINSVFGPG